MTPRLKSKLADYSAAVRHPKAEGYNLKVNDIWFRTVANADVPIQIGTRDSLAERTDDQGSTYANVLDIGYAWARSDLTGGEGLDWDPRLLALERGEVALDAVRYWDSNGIDTSEGARDEEYTFRLANDLTSFISSGTARSLMCSSGDYLYLLDNTGDTVQIHDDFTGTATASKTITASATTNVVAMAVLPNNSLMVACADGSLENIRVAPGDSFISIYTTPTDGDPAVRVWAAHGRFIFATENTTNDNYALRTADWDGSAWSFTDIDTSTSPYLDVVESGPAVVAALADGSVRTYSPNTQTAGLPLLPRGRTTMPSGETPVMIGDILGALLIVTESISPTTSTVTTRLYQSQVLDERFDYVVGQLQLKRTWTATDSIQTTDNEYTFATTRDAAFFPIIESNAATYNTSIWRFDVVTGGLSRLNEWETDTLSRFSMYRDRLCAIGTNATTYEGYYLDETKYVSDGWVIFPNINFGLNTDISWLSMSIDARDIASANGYVEVWISAQSDDITNWESTTWELVTRQQAASDEELVIHLARRVSRSLSIQIRVSSGLSTATPKVAKIGIRGIPQQRDIILLAPVNVSDYISVPGRRPTHIPALGDAIQSRLLDLAGEAVEVEMLDPTIMFRGVLNNVSEPITYQAPRGSVSRYCLVEFRGERIEETAEEQGIYAGEGLGVGVAGVVTAGLDQEV